MRTLAATAALLVLSTACLAEPNITILKTVPTVTAPRPPLHLPPVIYDHPYKGKLTIETVTREELMTQCAGVATTTTLGCASWRGDRCHIRLLADEIIKAAGWTRELMLRHEIAHCNGWPADHPGKRPYPGPGPNQEAIPIIPEPLPRSKAGEVTKPVLRWLSE
jgi:hypothetical protein